MKASLNRGRIYHKRKRRKSTPQRMAGHEHKEDVITKSQEFGLQGFLCSGSNTTSLLDLLMSYSAFISLFFFAAAAFTILIKKRAYN